MAEAPAPAPVQPPDAAAASPSDGGSGGALRRWVAQGWTFHQVTGHLLVRLSGAALSEQAITSAVLPELSRLAARDCAGEGCHIRKARVDLSGCGLTDAALREFLAGWCQLGLGASAVCLMLQRNHLTDASIRTLADFAAAEGTGPLEELHASHQAGPSALTRAAVLALLSRLAACAKYPIWAKRARSFRPVHVRLGHCGVLEPEEVAVELEAATGARVCFADDQGCIRTACQHARAGGRGCPVAHLFDFRSQERPLELPPPPTPEEALRQSSAGVEEEGAEAPSKRRKGKAFLCGACGRELPIDMFTRSQFQKAPQLDEERGNAQEGGSAPSSGPRAHLVRRCNECVMQPCCACGAELALSAFAGTQMLRPPGSRRCRPCAAETWLCARCERPRLKAEFSSVEAKKGKRVAKVCRACEGSNPYFERRHAISVAFSGRYAGPPSWLPALAREVIIRILEYAREGRFIKVNLTNFECALCGRSWSLLISGDGAPVERHLRTSQLHQRRLRSLEAGNLVEIASTGLDPSRFRDGLGVRGAFCGREQVAEAQQLVDLRPLGAAVAAGGLAEQQLLEALAACGCGSGALWATQEQVLAAQALLAAAAVPEEEEEAGETGAGPTSEAPADPGAPVPATDEAAAVAAQGVEAPRRGGSGAHHLHFRSLWKLCNVPAHQGEARRARGRAARRAAAAGWPGRAEDDGEAGGGDEEDDVYGVDAGELAQVQRFLSGAA